MQYSYIIYYLFAIIIFSAVYWKWYVDLLSPPRRLYYFYHGFKARQKTFCPTVLKEKNDTKRLIYLLPYIAASFTPVILIIQKQKLILSSLGYLYWRVLDTFDDLLVGEERKKSLRILHDRLQRLQQNGFASRNVEIDGFDFLNVGPRDEIYIYIVKTIERFDSVFLQLNEAYQDVLVRLVKHQTSYFFAISHKYFKTEQQYHNKCVSSIMTGLYFATFEVNRSLYGYKMDKETQKLLEDTCESFATGNIIKDLEKDFRQGISYHPELVPRGIIEEIRSDEFEKINEAREFLTYRGIRHLPTTCKMFKNEWNEGFIVKLMALLLKTYLVNNYRKYLSGIKQETFENIDTKRLFVGCLFATLWDWESEIVELDQEMLSWRPNAQPLWGGRNHIEA